MSFKTCFTGAALSLALVGCSESERFPKGHPADSTGYSTTGLTARKDVTISTNATVTWVQHVLANWKRRNSMGQPAAFGTLPLQTGCSFDAPAPGSKVLHVNIGKTLYSTKVYALTDTSIRRAAERMIDQIKRQGQFTNKGAIVSGNGDAMKVMDLAVTDVSQPVHLVLAGHDNRLWNIHAFPGVTISGISVLGGDAAGVLGVDATVPLRYMSADQLEKCNVTVARKPTSNWSILASNSLSGGKNTQAKLMGDFNRFAAWYGKTFGPLNPQQTVGAMNARHALVGPSPRVLSERMAHQPIKGATLYVSPTAQIFFAELSGYHTKKWRAAEALANRMSGGSIAALSQ